MKRTSISIILILVIILSIFAGCGKSNSKPNADDITDTGEEIDISIFPELDTSSEKGLELYRKEVEKRLSDLGEDDTFITDKEWEAISGSEWLTDCKYNHNTYFTTFSELYEETSAYYYPVVFRDGSQLILWYTSESGSLIFEKITGMGSIGSNYGGEVHYNDSDEDVISSKTNYTTTYVQETGEVKVYEFGKQTDSYSVPKNSVYCGFSYFEGYIFRNGTDVYSLNAVDTHNVDGSVVCIAHNVKYVVDADYYYGSDPWCQPLFLMADGSIKAYIGWEGNQDSPDDVSHLCDLQYEGSWDK